MSCPICAKPTSIDHRPFCSKRCADVDLGRWLGGHYRVPSTDPHDAEEAAEELLRRLEESDVPTDKPH